MQDKTKKTLKNIAGWILYIVILVVLVWGVPKGLAYALKTEYPIASITSGSMWPALKKGDMVLIKGIAGPEEINEGDIIVYENPKGFTIHRVIRINEDTVVTKGDANNVADSPVKYEDIIGKTLTFNQNPIRIPFIGNINILFNKGNL